MTVSAGVIRVRQGGSLDREAFQVPWVELFLVAEDIGGLNSSVPLTVAVLDENDNPPVFSPSSYSVRLPENSPTGMWMGLCLKIGANSPFIKMCRLKSQLISTDASVIFLSVFLCRRGGDAAVCRRCRLWLKWLADVSAGEWRSRPICG